MRTGTFSTNPHLSSTHAVIFEKAIAQAKDIDELKRAAEKHGRWLLGNDKTRLRAVYQSRALALGGTYGSPK